MKIATRAAGLLGVLFVLMLVLAMSGCSTTTTMHMRQKSSLLHIPAALPEGRESMNEVAVYVLAAAYTRAHYYEYGGVIVRLPSGLFAATRPITQGHAANTEIDEDPESYHGNFPIVADYHTHPCLAGYVPEVFSPTDLSSMRSFNRPGYILDECTGNVHYWQPGDAYDDTDGNIFADQTAAGRIIGHVPVDGTEITL